MTAPESRAPREGRTGEARPDVLFEAAWKDAARWRDAVRDVERFRTHATVNLRLMREERGLSLREVARRADLSAATLSYLERGDCRVAPETLGRVLRVLEAAEVRA